MTSFEGIDKELDFAVRYNWKKLRLACLAGLREKTADLGGLIDDMRDTEIMAMLNTLVTAERRKSGLDPPEDDRMSGDWEGVRWTTPPSENDRTEVNEDMKKDMEDDEDDDDDDDDDEIGDETTMMVPDTDMDLVRRDE